MGFYWKGKYDTSNQKKKQIIKKANELKYIFKSATQEQLIKLAKEELNGWKDRY